MWYDSLMPSELPKDAIEAAEAAVVYAQGVRRIHARRTAKTAARRVEDIDGALERLREVMAPLRSEIGKFPYGPQTTIAERNRSKIKAVSGAIQVERRKLWKMQTKEARVSA
jgi:hypothetical protein